MIELNSNSNDVTTWKMRVWSLEMKKMVDRSFLRLEPAVGGVQ